MPFDTGILYRDGQPLILDGGDYIACLDRAVAAVGLEAFRQDQAAARANGRYLGFGTAAYVEGTGVGPYETAQVAIEPSGSVVVTVALPSQGQGHETTLAQLCAELLTVPMERVRVVQGDTLALAHGGGTIASRTAVVVGNAVHAAARDVRDRALELAAEELEASVADLRLEDGRVAVVGSPDRGVTLGQLARGVSPGAGRRSPSGGLSLTAEAGFEPATVTFANGVHAVTVEVDPETGSVRIDRYVVVHDCGRLINPMIVQAQVVGGVAQGIGGALLEQLVYDETGQLLSGTLMDYGVPRSTDIPKVEVIHLETPSTRNPLGVMGVGEAGTIGSAAAIAAAVEDALRPFGGVVTTYPLTPEVVRELVRNGVRVEAPA
jgi:carbon-monoxide dehydrogenase large subunit